MSIDETDQRLLSLLRSNARTPVVELARQLGISRATVQNRLRRLERDGVIRGYTVKVGSELETPAVRALMSISTENADEAEVIRRLRGNPRVAAVHHTTGRWDLIAEIHAESLAGFNAIVGNLRLIDGVTATETNLLLDSYE
jgi:DNA-binding Lrp family transcriptional regulator